MHACTYSCTTYICILFDVCISEVSIQERPDPAEIMYQLKGKKLGHSKFLLNRIIILLFNINMQCTFVLIRL